MGYGTMSYTHPINVSYRIELSRRQFTYTYPYISCTRPLVFVNLVFIHNADLPVVMTRQQTTRVIVSLYLNMTSAFSFYIASIKIRLNWRNISCAYPSLICRAYCPVKPGMTPLCTVLIWYSTLNNLVIHDIGLPNTTVVLSCHYAPRKGSSPLCLLLPTPSPS